MIPQAVAAFSIYALLAVQAPADRTAVTAAGSAANRLVQSERACVRAYTLSGLRRSERDFLFQLCLALRLRSPDEGTGPKAPKLTKVTVRRVAEIAQRLERQSATRGWQLAVAHELVAPAWPNAQWWDDSLRSCLSKGLKKRKTDLAKTVAKAKASSAAPIGLPWRWAELGADCGEDSKALLELSMVVAEPGESVAVLVGGQRPAGMEILDRTSGGAALLLTPKLTPFSVVVSRGGRPPVVTHTPFPNASNVPVPRGIDEVACLDLQAAVGSGTGLYVDGRETAPGPQVLAPGKHVVTTLQRVQTHWVIVAEEIVDLSRSGYGDNRCQVENLDLRLSRGVALTAVEVDDACGSSGPSGTRVWGSAARFLQGNASRANLEFRDLNGVARAGAWLNSVRAALTSLGGKPVGSARGQLATEVGVGRAAQELWRQGVSRVVSLEVQCREAPGDGALRLSVLGRALNTQMIHERAKDPVKGVDLKGFVRVETEALRGGDSVEQAVRRVSARLLAMRYVRFSSAPIAASYNERIELLVEVVEPPNGSEHAKKARVTFEAFSPEPAVADAICGPLVATGRVAGRPPTDSVLGRRVPVLAARAGTTRGESRTFLAEVRPEKARPLIVRASLTGIGRSNAAYHCIDVVDSTHRIGVQALVGGEVISPNRSATERRTFATRLSLHYSRRVRKTRPMRIGGAIGLSVTSRRFDAPPDWADVTEIAGESPGRQPLRLTRFGLVAGPRVAWRTAACSLFRRICGVGWRRVKFGVTLGVDADLGIVDRRGIPDSLPAAKDRTNRVDFDVGLVSEWDIAYSITNTQEVAIGMSGWLQAMDDGIAALLADERREARADPNYDAFVMWGVFLRYSWGFR